MAKVNFIFKNNQYIKGIGGKLPSNVDPSMDVHIKGSRGYYYLAETEDVNLQKLTQWEPMIVSEQVARGFPLIGLTQIYHPDTDSYRDLTTQEEEDQHAAEKAMKKLDTRAEIHGAGGDIHDLVADLSKRVGMMERIVARTMHWMYNSPPLSGDVPQEFKDNYGAFLDQYIYDVDQGNYVDRVDIESLSSLYSKLKTRYNAITTIMEDYLNY